MIRHELPSGEQRTETQRFLYPVEDLCNTLFDSPRHPFHPQPVRALYQVLGKYRTAGYTTTGQIVWDLGNYDISWLATLVAAPNYRTAPKKYPGVNFLMAGYINRMEQRIQSFNDSWQNEGLEIDVRRSLLNSAANQLQAERRSIPQHRARIEALTTFTTSIMATTPPIRNQETQTTLPSY